MKSGSEESRERVREVGRCAEISEGKAGAGEREEAGREGGRSGALFSVSRFELETRVLLIC